MTELPIDDTAGLANAAHDAADVAVAEEALAEWDDDDRRTYRLADADARDFRELSAPGEEHNACIVLSHEARVPDQPAG